MNELTRLFWMENESIDELGWIVLFIDERWINDVTCIFHMDE